jgi:hypothetical protein
MTDRVQPGTEIDEEVWKEFREEVARRRGGTRGHIRNELENALRAYSQAGDATPGQIDARLQRIEAAVGVAPTDGGSTASEAQDTHTDDSETERLDERPRAKASRSKTIQWLVQCVNDWDSARDDELPRERVISLVKDEYEFRSDTAKMYVERVIDHFDMVEHPTAGKSIMVTKERRDEINAALAEEEIEEMAQAEQVKHD